LGLARPRPSCSRTRCQRGDLETEFVDFSCFFPFFPMLMLRAAMTALLLATVTSLRVGARAGQITMGLSVGDKMPSSVLSKAGIAGKKAVIFFCA
jgi:hypothetical protein